jgi:diguanylate cyclase (GGDEF)-like protein
MPVSRSFLRPEIANERQRRRFTAIVTASTIAAGLSFDIPNQLLFFESWAVCFRNWAETAGLAGVITYFVAGAIAKGQLELYQAKKLAEELSRTDPLTGLPNRRGMADIVARTGVESLALVIADIDSFKRVNDRHGHLVGDVVIQKAAERISADLADLGRVVRLGGEEFALLSTIRDRAALEASLNRCREALAATPIVVFGASVRITISAGAAFAEPGQTFEEVYAAADRALYVAKNAGRNRVMFSDQLEVADDLLDHGRPARPPIPENRAATRR